MTTIVFCYGTRPEAIKIAPCVAELRALGIQPRLISTGQHWDLLRGTPAETDLCDSESLGLPASGNPIRWVGDATSELIGPLTGGPPGMVVVQGDTASAMAGASAAYAIGMPIAHIEAGVRSRSFNEPYPEEMFRTQITQLAQWHYAPTQHCVENLLAEGIPEDRIVLTGNPVVSAIARYSDVRPAGNRDRRVLFTMHRREWQAQGIQPTLDALTASAERVSPLEIVWPKHPSVQLPVGWAEHTRWNLRVIAPLPYGDTLRFLANCTGVLTDSGGLVEEATTLGIPTAILRNANDRPEAVDAGIARQFSPTDLERAFDWLRTQEHPRKPSDVFGTPDAAAKIAKHLATLQ